MYGKGMKLKRQQGLELLMGDRVLFNSENIIYSLVLAARNRPSYCGVTIQEFTLI